jgi:CubicO group peptidase (beta-lactamase class C family)
MTVLLLVGLVLPVRAEDRKPVALDRHAVDAILKQARIEFEAPCVACAIVKDDKVLYLEGSGFRQDTGKEPVTPDTLFGIASCSKAFTATAIGMLVADGKMRWDDPVRKHLSAYRMSDALADRDVTIRDLLCHRTGVIRHDILWVVQPWGRDELIRRSALIKPDRPFRSGYGYNNFQYLAAGEAAGKVAGMSWEQLVQKRILDPLGMKSANFSTNDMVKTKDYALPHRKIQGKLQTVEPHNIDHMAPAGSINASVRDLAQWLRFQLGKGKFEGKRLLRESVLEETHTPQVVVPMASFATFEEEVTTQVSYGLGWRIYDYRGRRVVAHGGSLDGYRSEITLLPEQKLGVVVLTNLASTPLPRAVTFNLLDLLLEGPKEDWNKRFLEDASKKKADEKKQEEKRQAGRKPNTKPSLPLAEYAGAYEEPAHGQVRITEKDGVLWFHWGKFTSPLESFHFDTFTLGEVPERYREMWGDRMVTFRLDADGTVESFTFLKQGFRKKPPAKKGGG